MAILTAGALALQLHTAHAGHVYGGIIDTNGTPGLQSGDALAFVNQTTGVAITGSSLGTLVMSPITSGAQAGLYLSTSPSFTGLSNGMSWNTSTGALRAANAYAALSGTLIQLQITSIAGPTGAKFSFWDESISLTDPALTYTIGSSGATAYWDLTDLSLPLDAAGTTLNNPPFDPYGHLHGRSFTVDAPGQYTVSFVLRDANGIQADSAPFVLNYSAVPEPVTVGWLMGAAVVLLVLFRRKSRKA
jgi:hypothetical protein